VDFIAHRLPCAFVALAYCVHFISTDRSHKTCVSPHHFTALWFMVLLQDLLIDCPIEFSQTVIYLLVPISIILELPQWTFSNALDTRSIYWTQHQCAIL